MHLDGLCEVAIQPLAHAELRWLGDRRHRRNRELVRCSEHAERSREAQSSTSAVDRSPPVAAKSISDRDGLIAGLAANDSTDSDAHGMGPLANDEANPVDRQQTDRLPIDRDRDRSFKAEREKLPRGNRV